MTSFEQIKLSVSMADVLNRYGFEPNSKGFMKCPFHSEDTASLKVYDKSNTFYCFGCNEHGDVFDFVMKMENCDLNAAVNKLDCGELTFLEKRKLATLQREINKQKQQRITARGQYYELLDEWIRLDKNTREYKPKAVDEALNPLFVEALKNIKHQEYLLNSFREVW